MTSSEMPKKLGKASRFAVVSPNKLSAKYFWRRINSDYVGTVQADKSAPVDGTTMYYFEMQVKNNGVDGFISIGFTTAGYDLTSHPGWGTNSVGYHGNDGMFYINGSKCTPPTTTDAATFTRNDVVGAGIDYVSNEFFFTKNGRLVGTAIKEFDGPLFPSISVHSEDEEVEVNFGKKPFQYDHRSKHLEENLKKVESSLKKALEEKEKEVANLKLSNVTSEGKWKELLEEKLDKLMEKSETSSLKKALNEEGKECVADHRCCEWEKVIEEKNKELASFKDVLKELLN